jgi:FkbM family methyltransferase
MKTGIAVFAYNRNIHLSKTLAGLKANKEVKEIYVFQDGLKTESHRAGWEATKKVISDIDWCKVNYILANKNKGLAKSIVDGVNYVLADNDAIVVLEDDCVPAPNFISFMLQCFDKYQNNKSVFSVSGYSWPVDVRKDDYDIYFTGRISSWGWGTWKDRWNQYEVDNHILDRLRQNEDSSLNLAKWGNDLENMFRDRIAGKNDSWAIYWALKAIEQKGWSIVPYVSLIQNIGCDGTGVHCGESNQFWVELDKSGNKQFKLPDDVIQRKEVVVSFASLYGSYTAIQQEDNKKKILVYGVGNYFKLNEQYLNRMYAIQAFIDQAKDGYYAGKRIIKPQQIQEFDFDVIVIMIQNIQECIKVAKCLRCEWNVPVEKIMISAPGGARMFGSKEDSIVYTEDDKVKLCIDGIACKVGSLDEFNNVVETLVNQVYNYYIDNDKKDIVIDIGMNIGDATLFFLKQEKVKKVYGYEPFGQTFLSAKDNLKEYLKDKDRLEIFQLGVSGQNETRQILYNKDMSCGQSAVGEITESARMNYQQMGLISKEHDTIEQIEVRKASEILKPIIDKYGLNYNIVLKMDCEGDEYEIIRELFENGLLNKISFIMMEWHYRGKEMLLDYLKKAKFSFWCSNKNADMGLIYAYKNCWD